MQTSSAQKDEFEYLDLQDPVVRATFIETYALRFSRLVQMTNAMHPEHAVQLDSLFTCLLTEDDRYSPEKHASFSAWAYQVALRTIRQKWPRKVRKKTAFALAHLLNQDPHTLTTIEIAEALLLREFFVEKQLRRSPPVFPETPTEQNLPNTGDLLAQISLQESNTSAGANKAFSPRQQFPFQEALWLVIGLGIIIIAIFSFIRSDDSDLGVAMFPSPTPPLPQIVTVDNPKVMTAPIFIDPYAGRFFASTLSGMSQDGKKIVFMSNSPFILSDDTDDVFDIYLYDTETDQLELVSKFDDFRSDALNYLYPAITANGQEIAFYRETYDSLGSANGVLIKNIPNGVIETIPMRYQDEEILNALSLSISADGRIVAFYGQTASDIENNCETADQERFCVSLFMWSRDKSTMYKIPIGAILSPWTSRLDMTADGSLIALSINEQSALWNRIENKYLEVAILYDWLNDEILPVLSAEEYGQSYWPGVSSDGRFVTYTIRREQAKESESDTTLMILDRATGARRAVDPPIGQYIGIEDAPEDVSFQYGNQPVLSADGNALFYLSKIPAEQANPSSTFCGTGSYGGKLCFEILKYDIAADKSESIDLMKFFEAGARISMIRFLSSSSDGKDFALTLEGWELDYPCPQGFCSTIWASLGDEESIYVSKDTRLQYGGSAEEQWYFKLSLVEVSRWVKGLALSPDGKWIATGDQSGSVRLFDTESLEIMHAFEETTTAINTLAVSADGRMLAAGAQDDSVLLWDTRSRTLIAGLYDHPGLVLDAAFSPDGKLLAVGSQKALWIWSITDDNVILLHSFAQENVNALAFSPDGKWLAVVNQDEIWIRSAKGGEVFLRLSGDRAKIKDVAFSPQYEDEYLLATGSINKEVIVWAISKSEKQPRAEYRFTLEHHDWVSALAFSPDGGVLAAGSFDSYINLWSMPDGTHIQDLQKNLQDQVLQLVFSNDGKTLYASTVNGVRIWQNRVAQTPDQLSTRFFEFSSSDRLNISQDNYAENYFRRENVRMEIFHTIDRAREQAGTAYRFDFDMPESFTLESITLFRTESDQLMGVLSTYVMTTNYQPARLNILQTPQNPIRIDWPISPTAEVIETEVSQNLAEMIVGGWGKIELDDDTDQASRMWNEGAASLWIRWGDNSSYYSMYFDQPFFSQAIPENDRLSISELFRIAQSIYP